MTHRIDMMKLQPAKTVFAQTQRNVNEDLFDELYESQRHTVNEMTDTKLS